MWTPPDESRTRALNGERPLLVGPWVPLGRLTAALGLEQGDRVIVESAAAGDLLPLLARGLCCTAPAPELRWLAELAMVAAAELGGAGAHTLLGCAPAGRRLWLYHRIRDRLGSSARRYWDHREPWIRGGIIGVQPGALGRWERRLGERLGSIGLLPALPRGAALKVLWRGAGGRGGSARSLARARADTLLHDLRGGAPAAGLHGLTEAELAQVPRATLEPPSGVPALCWWGLQRPTYWRGVIAAGWAASGPPPTCPRGWVARPSLAALLRTPLAGAPWVYSCAENHPGALRSSQSTMSADSSIG